MSLWTTNFFSTDSDTQGGRFDQMALQAVKDFTSNAFRLSPPRNPTLPSRRNSTQVASGATSKSKILAMLDDEGKSLNLNAPALPSNTTRKTKAQLTSQTTNLFVPGVSSNDTATSANSKSIPPFSSNNGGLGASWPPRETAERVPPSNRNLKVANNIETQSSRAKDTVTTHSTKAAAYPNANTQPPAPTKALPRYSYKEYTLSPAIVYTRHEEEANDLVQSLKGPLGFDLEWRVILRRGQSPADRRTAVIQLSDARMILVIQISSMQRVPQKVKEIIESPDVVKTGANIANDGKKLFRDFGILPANLVELGALAREADPGCLFNRPVVALARVVETYTGKELHKGKVRRSNWEGVPLSNAQLDYAANDAHCALMVYTRLIDIATTFRRDLSPAEYTSNLKLEDFDETGKAKAKTATPRGPISRESTTSSVTSNSSGTSQSTSASRTWNSYQDARPGDPPRPQHMRAYNMWHQRNMTLDQIRAALRSEENPLAAGTVISYVVRALQADPSLPFSITRLMEFVKLEAASWTRHREWVLMVDAQNRTKVTASS